MSEEKDGEQFINLDSWRLDDLVKHIFREVNKMTSDMKELKEHLYAKDKATNQKLSEIESDLEKLKVELKSKEEKDKEYLDKKDKEIRRAMGVFAVLVTAINFLIAYFKAIFG